MGQGVAAGVRRIAVGVAFIGVCLFLSACGGGGGGGSAMTTTPTSPLPPAPPPPPPPPPPPNYPTAASSEYQASYGLAAIHADVAYADGATGAGITVAVIDTGVNHTQPDLAVNVSSQSTDLYATRDAPDGEDIHGTLVAGIIAAAYNGFGTLGVAYDSTVLSIRADTPGSCASGSSSSSGGATSSSCSFDPNVLATGISYAVAHGAKVINLSLGTPDGSSGAQFEQALKQAVAAGVVFTIAAGNESAANPDYPALYAIDPRYAGSIIAVGATTQAGVLASYSNKAGTAAADYLVAPGDQILTGCDTQGNCYLASGTSFSAPHVAGALALLLQAFPNLTGQKAVSILLTTADKTGVFADQTTYGQGLLDLQAAFSPIGALSVPTPGGGIVPVQVAAGTNVSGPFGDAVKRTTALETVAYDSYQRLFKVNLATGYAVAPRSGMGGALTAPIEAAGASIEPRPGVRLDFSSGASDFYTPDALQSLSLQAQQTPRSFVSAAVTAGPLGVLAWRGQGGAAPVPGIEAARDAYAALARSDYAVKAAYALGPLQFAAEAGGSDRYSAFGLTDLDGSSYRLATLAWTDGPTSNALTVGGLTEPQGPLGSFLPNRTSFAAPASTAFFSARSDWLATPGLLLSAEGGVGETRASGQVLALNTPVLSSNWRLSARTLCGGEGCVSLVASVGQPIRVERGRFTATLADVPADYGDPLTFSTRSFSAAPSGREIDLRVGLERRWRALGVLSLEAMTIVDDGNQAGEPLDFGLVGSWRAAF